MLSLLRKKHKINIKIKFQIIHDGWLASRKRVIQLTEILIGIANVYTYAGKGGNECDYTQVTVIE